MRSKRREFMSRLEEIKGVVKSQKEAVRKLSYNDLNWLIKQAEKVYIYEPALMEIGSNKFMSTESGIANKALFQVYELDQ
jgi:hypothetical protein